MVYGAGIGLTIFFLTKAEANLPVKMTRPQMLWELAFGNIMDLRSQLSSTIGYLPHAWAIIVKQFIPHVLLVLFINLAQAKDPNTGKVIFSSYGDYKQWPFQVGGTLTVEVS